MCSRAASPPYDRIELLDGSFRTVKVRGQTTCQDVCDDIANRMGLTVSKFQGIEMFGLYQMASNKGVPVAEHRITQDMRLLDVVGANARAKENNPESTVELKLVYKVCVHVCS